MYRLLQTVALFAALIGIPNVESALSYRYRPLGGELKFVKQTIQDDEYEPPVDPDSILYQIEQLPLSQLENQQLQLPILLQAPNGPGRVRPFESFIRKWTSMGNGYARKITRSSF